MKNGIRLSYSKNPLGVRTPTSADTGGPNLQQQQQQLVQTLHNHHLNHHQQFGSGDGGLGHPRMDDYGAATTPHRVQQPTQTQPRRDTTSSTSLSQGQLPSFIGLRALEGQKNFIPKLKKPGSSTPVEIT